MKKKYFRYYLCLFSILLLGIQIWIRPLVSNAVSTLNPHPRIFLTSAKLASLSSKASSVTSDYTRWKNWIDSGGGSVADLALIYKITGNTSYRTSALSAMDVIYNTAPAANCSQASYNFVDAQENYMISIAMGYDWLYSDLGLSVTGAANFRQFLIDRMTCINNYTDTSADWTPYQNYLLRGMHLLYIGGVAIFGDDASAQTYIDKADSIYNTRLLPTFDSEGNGKGWFGGGPPEGTGYGISPDIETIVEYAVIKKSAENVDLITGVQFYPDVLTYMMNAIYPTDYKGKMFMSGDYSVENYNGERRQDGLDSKSNTRNIMTMLIDQMPTNDVAKYAQSFLGATQFDVTTRYDNETLGDVLWYNSAQSTLALSGLPPFYHAKGTGTVLMRSDWNAGATWIGIMAGDHYGYHQHVDQGSFQIAKYGQLAIKSGNYYCTPREDCMLNYVLRTVASNSVLLYDPSETFTRIRANDTYRNDGGQRGFAPATPEPTEVSDWVTNQTYYDTADILRSEDTTTHSYVATDVTNAYSSNKMAKFIREFAYLRPLTSGADDYLVVYDRVSSKNASYQKKWLLHTLQEPAITKFDGSTPNSTTGLFWTAPRQVAGHVTSTDGDIIKADDLSGRLFANVVLPINHTVTKVGGTGYENWVVAEDGGINHLPASLGSKYKFGSWRVEVEPATAQTDDRFLVVLYPAANATNTMPATASVTVTGGIVGAHIKDSNLNRVVVFSSDINGAAISGQVSYAYTPTAVDTKHYLFNLTPLAQYDIILTLNQNNRLVTIKPGTQFTSSVNGTITFNSSSIIPSQPPGLSVK